MDNGAEKVHYSESVGSPFVGVVAPKAVRIYTAHTISIKSSTFLARTHRTEPSLKSGISCWGVVETASPGVYELGDNLALWS